MEEIEIGRLIRSTNQHCPDCKQGGLQLRVKDDLHLIDGENVIQKNQYHYCSHCDYLVEVKNKKFSRKREWKAVEIIPEPEPIRKWDKNKKSGDDKGYSKSDKPKFSKKG